ncbi:dynamin family protein [Alkalinema sp. FACHB-956]|uniref:dynamin family protein n=1 Tax=Alkalinema sp. FACHB-956 TaxID=2692768 RepID=UPI001689EB5F|nr:dynamin family protein [Alkalinema sp. FACHB-956]MBD2329533.1 dynamin family protein [Alkalinema sp. FACHB-956]
MIAAAPVTDRTTIAKLLSQLTNQEISPAQVSKLVVFVSALSTLLVGVAFADRQVTEAEKKRLVAILNEFIPKSSSLYNLLQLMLKGVIAHQLHHKLQALRIFTQELSESEILLLLSLGYELAMADGTIDAAEEDYLVQIAQQSEIDLTLTHTIKATLATDMTADPDLVLEVLLQLDPARFRALDPVFCRAAERISDRLLTEATQSKTSVDSPAINSKITTDYSDLEKFQTRQHSLKQVVGNLELLLNKYDEHLSLPKSIYEDIATVQQNLNSAIFRVAIVGEFSQGKSTLLNALLGEEIQPVRAIPCSGTVTVLRYGPQIQVIGRYRDGREEEMPFDQYQEKAALSEDAALGNREDALANADLFELVLEHPQLTLCKQGVELVDSPGLNEHPERSRLTQQLLDNVDAVIFLVNAQRPLTQGERELLLDVRKCLNYGQTAQPVNNLFVLVNFMDLLRRQQDRQQVQQLFERFLLGENPILSQPERLHFISAQAALDAIIKGEMGDPYVQGLQNFSRLLQAFLTEERGTVKLKKIVSPLYGLLQQIEEEIQEHRKVIEGEIIISAANKQKIIEQIGQAVGYVSKLEIDITRTQAEQQQNILGRLSCFLDAQFQDTLQQCSKEWSTQHTEKGKIQQAFLAKFQDDTNTTLQEWTEKEALQRNLLPVLKDFDYGIHQMLVEFQDNLAAIDGEIGSYLENQLNLEVQKIFPQLKLHKKMDADDWETMWNTGIGSGVGLGAGGVVVGGLAFAVSSIAFFPIVLSGAAIAGIAAAGAALGTAIGGTLGFFAPPDFETIKKDVLNAGFQQLATTENIDRMRQSISTLVEHLFQQRLTSMQRITEDYLYLLNSLLEDWEQKQRLTPEQAALQLEVYQECQRDLSLLRESLD